MDTFRTVRFVVGLIQVLGWIAVGAGAVVFGKVYLDGTVGQLILVAAGLVFFGILTVATAQISIAVIATAENTGELVRLARAAATPGTGRKEPPPLGQGHRSHDVGEVIKTYKGREIRSAAIGVEVDGEAFPTVIVAERTIDGRTGQ